MDTNTVVAIAGVTGFVGRKLFANLTSRSCRVIGLSRNPPRPDFADNSLSCIRLTNLFHLNEVEAALEGVHVAFYLVHSMLPQTALSQGHFSDMDLLCADNFARAAKKCNLQHIIYLAGLLPDDTDPNWSKHLRSRAEVEATLSSYGVKTTTLRAGLILGGHGSSFQMMQRLVARLPLMLAPRWTASKTQPVALADVLFYLEYVLDHPPQSLRTHYDIGCNEVLTYMQLMQLTATCMGKNLRYLPVPVIPLWLSLWWVSVISHTPYELVYPLVASLRHDLVVQDNHQLAKLSGYQPTPLRVALENALTESKQQPSPPLTKRAPTQLLRRQVMAVHRLPMPRHHDIEWIVLAYAQFLQAWLWPFMQVKEENKNFSFIWPWPRCKLLELRRIHPSTHVNVSPMPRAQFHIAGGALTLSVSDQSQLEYFEFRPIVHNAQALAIVQGYAPRLPWLVYMMTQARLHQWLMRSFARYLGKQVGS